MIPDNEYINEYYSIGYNATPISKEYFRTLNQLVNGNENTDGSTDNSGYEEPGYEEPGTEEPVPEEPDEGSGTGN